MAMALAPAAAKADCAGRSGACETPTGTYELMLPDKSNAPVPVVIFLHGFGSTGMAMLKTKRISGPMLKRGYAVIAPNALRRGENGPTSWSFHPNYRGGRDEAAFIQEVLADAAENHSLDLSRVLLSGFSIGGSMTSYIACENPDLFSAYAPVSGNVWRPHPTSCAAPVKLFHTHGWEDSTVPLEGRVIRENFVQGDVFEALNLWRQTNECDQPRANLFSVSGIFMRRAWTKCARDSALEFVLFPGGHRVPEGWADMTLNWFEKHVPPALN